MVNLDNVRKWTKALRETDQPQVNGVLAAMTGDGRLGFCCLGLGCEVAGIQREVHTLDPDEVEDRQEVFYYDDNTDLPPAGFHDWLGDRLLDGQDGEDVALDWPEYHYEVREPSSTAVRWMSWTCAGLNDDCGLTFPQIADMIDYFGIKEQ